MSDSLPGVLDVDFQEVPARNPDSFCSNQPETNTEHDSYLPVLVSVERLMTPLQLLAARNNQLDSSVNTNIYIQMHNIHANVLDIGFKIYVFKGPKIPFSCVF